MRFVTNHRNLSFVIWTWMLLLVTFNPASADEKSIERKRILLNEIEFQLPRSLDLQSVATAPLVQRPIVADWDEQGRLVIVESAGTHERVQQQLISRPNRMIRLVDDNQDGVFDRRIVAAENLSFPEGVLCIGNRVLVAAPPEIWCFIDEDGDGVCERREVWYDGKTLTNCANDLHGPYLGRDGWVYWCKGGFGEQPIALPTGKTINTKASQIYRRKPEGGPVETVMTGGMDNPIEVAFTPTGERFFTSTFLLNPGGGKRDGIVHAIYGGLYGKEHNAINGHIRTGSLMPLMTHLGPGAPSGLAHLDSDMLVGPSNLFAENSGRLDTSVLAAAHFNLQKVTLHTLVSDGATFHSLDQDLLSGDRIDFHPTDCLEAPDGSLIVIDTGGWYDLCCPSSSVDQDKALGGVYRISSENSRRVTDARGENLEWTNLTTEQLAQRFSDSRTWVRRRASDWCVAHSQTATLSLALLLHANPEQNVRSRLESLWTLCRIGSSESLASISAALTDPSDSIRHAACNALATHRKGDTASLEKIVSSDSHLQVRRAAAEALGRMGQASSIKALMQGIADEPSNVDRVLEHSLLYAMIEINHPEAIAPFLTSQNSIQLRSAIVVLDQLGSQLLLPKVVFQQAQSSDPKLREVSIEVLKNHPSWTKELGGEIEALWQLTLRDANARQVLAAILQTWQGDPQIRVQVQGWIANVSNQSGVGRQFLLGALSGIKLDRFPGEWVLPVASWIDAADPSEAAILAAWLRRARLDAIADAALTAAIVKRASQSNNLNEVFAWVAALPNGTANIPETIGDSLVDAFLKADDTSERARAADAISRIKLSSIQAVRIIAAMEIIEPLRLPIAVAAVNRVGLDPLDRQMLMQLPNIPAARTLSTDNIVSIYRNRSTELQHLAKLTAETISRPSAAIEETLTQLAAELPKGDPVRGLQVFRGSKASCSACHLVGYVGGNIGPELSKIGKTRTRRDLLEAILYPSSRFAQSYQPIRVVTVDGQTFNGLVKNETTTSIELILGADKTVSIPIAEIEVRKNSETSIMPAGLNEVISKQDMADLIAAMEMAK